MRILIAEDNPSIQEIMGEFMDIWDFDFDMASNGSEAFDLAIANEGKYDLCLMDIDMPIMNGYEATKIIRRKLRYLPIMAVTGNLEFKDKYLESGMDDFIEKPYILDKLYDKINELTLKTVKIYKEQNQISLEKEMPMDSEELRELRELNKKGLTKLSLIGKNNKFVVHKNTQNKISHDLIGKGKLLSEFLDRSPDAPGVIHLYASNLDANKKHILPEVLEQLVIEEDKEMEIYATKAEYPEEDS